MDKASVGLWNEYTRAKEAMFFYTDTASCPWTVIDEARDLGYLGMQFNAVVASNTRALRLWQSMGFEIVGTVPDAFRHSTDGLTPIHVMHLKL